MLRSTHLLSDQTDAVATQNVTPVPPRAEAPFSSVLLQPFVSLPLLRIIFFAIGRKTSRATSYWAMLATNCISPPGRCCVVARREESRTCARRGALVVAR